MKQSELLRKQADMMDLAEKHGFADWRDLVMIEISSGHFVRLYDFVITLNGLDSYKFALGGVEGKPVFEGDELYFHGMKRIATGGSKNELPDKFDVDGWTWNPPKPRTILVELLVEDAKFLIGDKVYFCSKHGENIQSEVRKALESIK